MRSAMSRLSSRESSGGEYRPMTSRGKASVREVWSGRVCRGSKVIVALIRRDCRDKLGADGHDENSSNNHTHSKRNDVGGLTVKRHRPVSRS